MNKPDRKARILGALLGVHAGDSLGATCEFMPHNEIAKTYPTGLRDIIGGGPFRWPAGHATDDTDMTRGVLLAYRDIAKLSRDASPDRGDPDVASIAGHHFLDWLNGDWPDRVPGGGGPEDIGNATSLGLSRFHQTRSVDDAGSGRGSAGNGSLMRCIPTALFQKDRKKLVTESMRISKITHDDQRCTQSCAVYNLMAAELVDMKSPDEAVQAAEALASELEGGQAGQVLQALKLGRGLSISDMAQDGPPRDLMPGRCSGYVLESLMLAVAAVLDERCLESVLIDVVRIGKDTDTNGAIAGGLLGARSGIDAIPERWRKKLQFAKEFTDVASEILELQTT